MAREGPPPPLTHSPPPDESCPPQIRLPSRVPQVSDDVPVSPRVLSGGGTRAKGGDTHRCPPPPGPASLRAAAGRELTLQKGDIVYIHKEVDRNWLEGEHHGRVGIFPSNYVEVSLGVPGGFGGFWGGLEMISTPLCPHPIGAAPHRGAQAHQGAQHPGAGVRRGPGALQLPRGAARRALLS